MRAYLCAEQENSLSEAFSLPINMNSQSNYEFRLHKFEIKLIDIFWCELYRYTIVSSFKI